MNLSVPSLAGDINSSNLLVLVIYFLANVFQLNTGSREIIDLNFGPIGERINSAGSDISLGSDGRRGSSSSLSSTDAPHMNSTDRKGKSSSQRRADSLNRRHNSSSDRQREISEDKRVGSAGSDSDSSMSSTLKVVSPRALKAVTPRTLKAVIPQTLTIDLSVTHLDHEDSITYEQLQSMIEIVLVECGYYSMSPQGREKTPPLGTFMSDSVRNRLLASSQFM